MAISHATGSIDPGTIQARGGGDPSSTLGGPGTIFLVQRGQSFGRLIVDNAARAAETKTPIWFGDRFPTSPQPPAPYSLIIAESDLDDILLQGDLSVFDRDRNGLPDWIDAANAEYVTDSNGDGISDKVQRSIGQDPFDPDNDDDQVSNADEVAQGTNPNRADSDGDGAADGSDFYPLDPTLSEAPPAIPGDTTPPVITIDEPVGTVPAY